jgi:hypothetical protein
MALSRHTTRSVGAVGINLYSYIPSRLCDCQIYPSSVYCPGYGNSPQRLPYGSPAADVKRGKENEKWNSPPTAAKYSWVLMYRWSGVCLLHYENEWRLWLIYLKFKIKLEKCAINFDSSECLTEVPNWETTIDITVPFINEKSKRKIHALRYNSYAMAP